MTDSRAGIRRRSAATAGAAALLVVLGGMAASGCAASPRADEPPQRAKLTFTHELATSYLRNYTESERAEMGDPSELFSVGLAASRVSPGTGQVSARNIKVTVDTTATKSVTFNNMHREQGCKGVRGLITCTPKNLKAGDSVNLLLFDTVVRRDVEDGPAGPIEITVTSDNAPTIHRTIQLVAGAPQFAARQGEGLTDVAPGSEVKVRPAFGISGRSGLDDDLSVVVDVKGQATLRREFSNCRYDTADAPKTAVCTFPRPLPAGAAYETDRPFTAAIDGTGRQGAITYTVYPAPNTPSSVQLPDSAPRGTGAPLGFRPVDGSLFATFGPEFAYGVVPFLTTRARDLQVNGFALKGQVGQTNDVSVKDLDGYYEDGVFLTLPEGVSLAWHPTGEGHEELYCDYVDEKSRKVLCPAPLIDPPTLRFRIDKRVEGARGTVSVQPDPEHPDPDLTNNTAPITVEYVD
ncbi:hypothetical protein [Streptomyces lunalinharesii]|uniref:Lipoprotein n=1 Tax=Streptomyces lunalinharesii TaxID=333384 RepID=A0ABP6FC53_9ACTN